MITLARKANNALKFAQAWRHNLGYKLGRLDVTVSARCNARCMMCNVWKLDKQAREKMGSELSFNEIAKVLTEAAEAGVSSIFLSGGEPLMRPDIIDIVAFARSLNISAVLFTNGLLLSEEKAQQLIEAGLGGIAVSLDSPEPGLHDEIRGVKGLWQRAVDGLKHMQQVKLARGLIAPTIHLHSLVTKRSLQNLAAMSELAENLGVDGVVYLPLINKTAKAGSDFGLDEKDYSVLAGLPGFVKPGHYKNHLCLEPWFKLTMDPFGEIYPCCFAMPFQNADDSLQNTFWGDSDRFSLGNVRDSSLLDIWNGEAMRAFRGQLHEPPQFSMCRWCNYLPREPFCKLEGILKTIPQTNQRDAI